MYAFGFNRSDVGEFQNKLSASAEPFSIEQFRQFSANNRIRLVARDEEGEALRVFAKRSGIKILDDDAIFGDDDSQWEGVFVAVFPNTPSRSVRENEPYTHEEVVRSPLGVLLFRRAQGV